MSEFKRKSTGEIFTLRNVTAGSTQNGQMLGMCGEDFLKDFEPTSAVVVSEITRGIIADLTARDLKGQREYGTTMDRADLTPEEWLDHEYAELLDAAQYNRAARRRVESMTREIEGLRKACLDMAGKIADEWGHSLEYTLDLYDVGRLKGEEVAG